MNKGQVWNNMRVSNSWENFHFWVNYSFKRTALIFYIITLILNNELSIILIQMFSSNLVMHHSDWLWISLTNDSLTN